MAGEIKRRLEAAVDMQLDKNDVIAIAVSDAESELNRRVKEYRQLAADADRQADGIKKELAEDVEHQLRSEVRLLLDNLVAAAKAFGVVLTSQDRFTFNDEGVGTLVISLHEGGSHRLGKSFTHVLTPQQRSRHDRCRELREVAAGNRRSEVDTRRQLSQIGTLERSVRADLARASLRRVEGGQEVLDAVLGDLSKRLLALPG